MRMPTRHSRRNGERGQTLILVAVMLPVLLGVTGLALDVGTLYNHRRRMQTAADAGALAGANEVWRARLLQVTPSGRAQSGANGFTHGAGGVNVTVQHPPTTGFHVGDARYVEVTVQQPAPTYLMKLFGFNEVDVVARAVAGAGANGENCIYALDESMPGAFQANSSANLDASCGIIVNSTSSSAMHLTSSVSVTATNVSVTGDYVTESNAYVSPTPQTSVPPDPDPLAYIPAPDAAGACNHVNWWRDNGMHTLNPGIYCGGINLRSNARVHLNPGTYILRGGGLKLESNSQITGTEVMLYNTQGAGYPYRPFEFQSSTQVRLTAPTSGTYTGILFFQDRNAGSPSDVNSLQSSTNSYLEGALYFPTQVLFVESSTTTEARYTIIVARHIRLDSSANFRVRSDYTGLSGGSPIKKLSLVE